MLKKNIFLVVDDSKIKKRSKKFIKETSRRSETSETCKILKTLKSDEMELDNTRYKNDKLKSKQLYMEKENINLFLNYGAEYFISNLKQEIQSQSEFLKYYSYNEHFFKVRTKMVDWMIEVFTSFKSNFQTLFHAVSLMDHFINNCSEIIETTDLHSIGMTCIYISSKYEDVVPITLPTLIQYVGHNLFKE